MSGLSAIGEKNYLPLKEEELVYDAEPLVNFKQVLSHLNPEGTQSASLVSRSWKKASLDVVNDELSKIRQFVEFLRKNLQEECYAAQKQKLFTIEIDEKILDSENLEQVQSSISRKKKNILNILKDLKEEDLKNLEEVLKDKNKSIFFEDIFDFIRIYQRLDQANQIDDYNKRNSVLRNISDELTKKNNFDMMIEIAETTLPKDLRNYALMNISRRLARKGNFDKAIEIANTITSDEVKNSALRNISFELARKGNFDKAIEIANTITNYYRSYALWNISDILVDRGNFDKAIEIVNTTNNEVRNYAFRNISRRLARKGNFDKAIEIANTITNDEVRNSALRDISKILAEKGNFDKAIEIANTITNDEIRNSALRDISEILAQKD